MGDTAQDFVFLPFSLSHSKRLIIILLVSAATAVFTHLFFMDFYARGAGLKEMTGMAGGMVLLLITIMYAGPEIQRRYGIRKITVDDAGFSLVFARRTITVEWSELIAAHFRVYDAGDFQIPAFIYLTHRHKKEISLTRLPEDQIKIFQTSVEKYLKDHAVPGTAVGLPATENMYSRIAFCFLVITGMGILINASIANPWLTAGILFCNICAMVAAIINPNNKLTCFYLIAALFLFMIMYFLF